MFANSMTKQLNMFHHEPVLMPQLSLAGKSGDSEMPILQLGMVGFNQRQRQQIEGIVGALPQQSAIWQVGNFTNADAWLVCGEKTRPAPNTSSPGHDSLQILAGLPAERGMTLNLRQVNRPLAFSTPLNDPDIEALFTFEPASPQSLQNLLTNFERCLNQLMLQFVLGKQLIEHEAKLRATVYHVMYGGKLLAVMDFIAWKIGLQPDADPRHFQNAVWEKRPIHANAIPGNFLHTDVAKLRWIYARHSARNVLPARYREGLIYFRQTPKITLSWLTDSQLQLIQELTQRPSSLVDLAQRTGRPREHVSRDLSCLYYACSLTTLASKAAQASTGKARPGHPGQTDSTPRAPPRIFNSSMPYDAPTPLDDAATVAAPLRTQ